MTKKVVRKPYQIPMSNYCRHAESENACVKAG
jgi:hypothetical protein